MPAKGEPCDFRATNHCEVGRPVKAVSVSSASDGTRCEVVPLKPYRPEYQPPHLPISSMAGAPGRSDLTFLAHSLGLRGFTYCELVVFQVNANFIISICLHFNSD